MARFKLNESTLCGKLHHSRQNVSAVLSIGDNWLIDKHLQKKIVDIGIGPIRAGDHRYFAREGVGAADAVDLARVRRAHDLQQKGIALRNVFR